MKTAEPKKRKVYSPTFQTEMTLPGTNYVLTAGKKAGEFRLKGRNAGDVAFMIPRAHLDELIDLLTDFKEEYAKAVDGYGEEE